MDTTTAPNPDQHPNQRAYALPAGTRVYAIGDMHGRRDLLDRLLDKIADDSRNGPERQVLVSLGDMVDRGPDSAGVIERLSTLKDQAPFDGFELHHLKGNHDQLMLDFLESGDDELWLSNGGAATLDSYGIPDPWAEADIVRAELNVRLPDAHRTFLHSLETLHREGDYVFVHAGICPKTPLDRQSESDLLWIRAGFLDCEEDIGVRVVHGHTPVGVPEALPNRIAVDTKAWVSGALTAFVGQDKDIKFITT